MDAKSAIEKVKDLIRKGNVSRILVKRNGETVLNLPVNVGVVGAVVGLASAKWVLLASVIATIGFGCTVEVVKADGDIINVMDEESNKKVRDFAADTVEKVKENIPVTINVDVRRDTSDEILDADVSEVHDSEETKE